MDGILNINKPSGMTSFDVVARLRRILGMKKIGHAGTLDPDATGVLPVCLGKATKIIEFLMEKDKAYHVVMRLGIETDTQDASGGITAENPVEKDDEEIESAINSFVGNIMQTPPMYSAIRIGGKRLYEIARQGREIEREARPVSIRSVGGISVTRIGSEVRAAFDVECSKGTYIRTLCADIGARLGCGGHMESLVRTRSGPFLLGDASTLEEVEEMKNTGALPGKILKADSVLTGLFPCTVSDEEKKRLKNGLSIHFTVCSGTPGDLVRIYGGENEFLAIGQVFSDGDKLSLKSRKWLEGT